MNRLKRFISNLSVYIDFFAVGYITGLFLIITGSNGSSLWTIIHALTWIIGAPSFCAAGAYSTKQKNNRIDVS